VSWQQLHHRRFGPHLRARRNGSGSRAALVRPPWSIGLRGGVRACSRTSPRSAHASPRGLARARAGDVRLEEPLLDERGSLCAPRDHHDLRVAVERPGVEIHGAETDDIVGDDDLRMHDRVRELPHLDARVEHVQRGSRRSPANLGEGRGTPSPSCLSLAALLNLSGLKPRNLSNHSCARSSALLRGHVLYGLVFIRVACA
jgi:hypothetical protein